VIYQHDSYRNYLRSVLADRIGSNPSYSLRALARALGLTPSQLSHVLQGEKNLSHERALQVATRLGLDARQTEYFGLLVQRESTKSIQLKEAALARMREINPASAAKDLSVDAFRAISDWYHAAILEIMSLQGIRATP
jgi:uncharacterized protein (TIGR02147 family)